MKKILYSILPLLAVAVACSKQESVVEPQPTPGEEEFYSIVAQAPEGIEEAKTTIGLDGTNYKLYWQNGDRISAGSDNISEALSGVSKESSVTFTFKKAVKDGDIVRSPGVQNPTLVVIPATQTSVGGQYDADANPLWGSVSVSSTSVPQAKVTLNNTMAMLKFSITKNAPVNVEITKAVIEAVGGQTINGNYTMDTSTGALSESGSNTSKTTVSFSAPLSLSATSVDLYIPVRPQNYTQGFKMTLHQSDGKYMQVTFFKTGQELTNKNLAYFNIAYAPTREIIDIQALGVLGAVSSTYEDDKPANGLRIGTYNVWSDKDRESKIGERTDFYKYRTWAYAKDAVASLVAAMDCDVICFNEITSNTCESSGSSSLEAAIKTYTSEYTYKMSWPNVIDKSWWRTTEDYTFANGFAYKGSNLTLSNSGMFWLSDNGSTSSDDSSYGKRTCVWAKFTRKSDGKVFYVAVTHLPIPTQGASDGAAEGAQNLQAAKNLISYLKTRTGASDSDTIILCGDMNSSNTTVSQGFKYIVNTSDENPNSKLVFTDVRDHLASQDKLSSSEKGLPGTSVGQSNEGSYIKSEGHRYDHIMFRNVTSVTNYKAYKKTFIVPADVTSMLWYPSDHLPISADFVF